MIRKDVKINNRQISLVGHNDGYLNHVATGAEKSLEFFCKKYVSRGATILDVGANIGITSLIFAICIEDATVYSFEPGPLNFAFLKTNIDSGNFRNIHPQWTAVGNENLDISFFENSAWGYVAKPSLTELASRKVKCITIDAFVEQNGLTQVDLIKIDVEGYEPKVFEGMLETIQKFNPKIIFEFNSFALLAFGDENPLKFLEYINTHFKNKFIFTKDLNAEELIIDSSIPNFAQHYLHENIVKNGSVDNFLVFN